MSSSDRRKFTQPAVVDMGCSCRRPRLLPSFMSSSSWRKAKSAFSPTASANTTGSSSSLWGDSITAAARQSPTSATTRRRSHERSEKDDEEKKIKKMREKKEKKGVLAEESVAVAKESSEPYRDFRDSMLQMVVEMEIYAWEDLLDLLHRFLVLNSPSHHHLIFCAFAEVWASLFSVSSSSSPSLHAGASAASQGGHRP